MGVRADDKGFVEPGEVRSNIEGSLKALKTDHVDCIQLHGPVYEYLGYDAGMRIYEQLDKLRGEKLFRYVGITGHTAFETMHRPTDIRLFDQALLAYGYSQRHEHILSEGNLQWRELCLARVRKLGMGIVAVKVMGSFLFGHNAALGWALREKKPDVLVVGVSLPSDIEDNIETLRRGTAFTMDDQKILAEFSVKALESKAVQAMKTT